MTAPQPGQPAVFRNATVLTMDDAHTFLSNADVLVTGETIAAVGPGLDVPGGHNRDRRGGAKALGLDSVIGSIEPGKAKASIESTVEYLKAEHGPQEWEQGMHPEIPEHETLNNPYTYRDDVSAWKETD